MQRKKAVPIHVLELVLWLALAVALEVLTRPLYTTGRYSGLLAGIILCLYPAYLYYLWLWRMRRAWSWIVLALTSSLLVMALPILLLGDALRRAADLVYRGEKPLALAFGRPWAAGPLRQRLRSGAPTWLALLLFVGAIAATLSYIDYRANRRPTAIAWPAGSGYLTPPAHRPAEPHPDPLVRSLWEYHGSGGHGPLALAPGNRIKNHTALRDPLTLADYNGDPCVVPYGLTVWVDEYGQFMPIAYDPAMPPPTAGPD